MSVFDSARNVESYELWFERYPHVFDSEVAAIKELLPEGAGFEVGIGTGLFCRAAGNAHGKRPV